MCSFCKNSDFMVGKKEAVMNLTASLPILYVYLCSHRKPIS